MLQNQFKILDTALVKTFDKVYHGQRPDNGETDLFIKRKPSDLLFNGIHYVVNEEVSKHFAFTGIKPSYSFYDVSILLINIITKFFSYYFFEYKGKENFGNRIDNQYWRR